MKFGGNWLSCFRRLIHVNSTVTGKYNKYTQDFVCVEVLRLSQRNGVMSSAISLPNHTCTGKAKGLTSILHILSPETDNCPS